MTYSVGSAGLPESPWPLRSTAIALNPALAITGRLRSNTYADHPHPWIKRTGGEAGSPRSTTRTVSPDCNRGKLTRYAGSPAGNIAPGLSGSRRRGMVIPLNQFNFSAEQFTYETNPKRDVGPLGLGTSCVIERKCRLGPRMCRRWAVG